MTVLSAAIALADIIKVEQIPTPLFTLKEPLTAANIKRWT